MEPSKDTVAESNTSDDELDSVCMTLDDNPDDDAPLPFLVFGNMIERIVDPRDIMSHLSNILNTDAELTVRKICKNKGSQSGMRHLFEILKEKKNIPDRWKTFVHAMEKSHYDYFAGLLKKEETLTFEAYLELEISLDKVALLLEDGLNPIDVFKPALHKGIISQEDNQDINRETNMHGDMMGLVVLMDKIWRKKNGLTSIFDLIQTLHSTDGTCDDESQEDMEKNQTSGFQVTDEVTNDTFFPPLSNLQPRFGVPERKNKSSSSINDASSPQWMVKTKYQNERTAIIGNVKIICTNDGCSFETQDLKDMENHKRSCGFEVIPCKAKYCSFQNIRKNMEIHSRSCLFFLSERLSNYNMCKCHPVNDEHELMCPKGQHKCPITDCSFECSLYQLHWHIITCQRRPSDRTFIKKKYECGNIGCPDVFLSKTQQNLHQDCYCAFRKIACKRKSQGCNFEGSPMEANRHEMESCPYRRDVQVHLGIIEEMRKKEQCEIQKDVDIRSRMVDLTNGRKVSDAVVHNLQEEAADAPIFERGRPSSDMKAYNSRRIGSQMPSSGRRRFDAFWKGIPYNHDN